MRAKKLAFGCFAALLDRESASAGLFCMLAAMEISCRTSGSSRIVEGISSSRTISPLIILALMYASQICCDTGNRSKANLPAAKAASKSLFSICPRT